MKKSKKVNMQLAKNRLADNIRHWLKYHFGNATKCENPRCKNKGAKRFNYILKTNKAYEKKRSNFKMFCAVCSCKYRSK